MKPVARRSASVVSSTSGKSLAMGITNLLMVFAWGWLCPGRDRGRNHVVQREQIHLMVRLVADRYSQPVAPQYEDALVGGARCPGSIWWEIGELAVDIGAEACRVAGAGMRRGQHVVGPALREEWLAVPPAVLQVQHTELRVVAQGREAGA